MSIDHYPSSFDYRSGDDGVLTCMVNARGRIAANHSKRVLIYDKEVCAVGGLLAAGGLTSEDLTRARVTGQPRTELFARAANLIEGQMREAVCTAMRLLDEAAVELVPESINYNKTIWMGPLEWVNQTFIVPRETKAKILEIYDYAIAKRAAEVIEVNEPQERELVPA